MIKNLGKNKVKTGGLKRNLINFGAVVTLGALVYMVIQINTSKEDLISIVRVKEDVYTNQLLVESNLVKYDMVKREFDNSGGSFLLWDNKEECVEKYSSVFVRSNGYVTKGDYLEYKPIKNPWMQEVADDQLFVTLKYDRAEAFGNIITPGDRVKVDISYTVEETNNNDMFSGVVSRSKNEVLFEDIKIIDLLNSSGNSIYDYYTDLLNMPLRDREDLLRDESFLSDVAPVSMILQVNKGEEFSKYSKMRSLQGVKYTYGLLPRKEGDIVIDQFKDLTRQISQNQTQAIQEGGR